MRAANRVLNPAWTPADFLLDGRYCEREVIAEEVAQIRAAAHAEQALLIAYRGTTLFHTLLVIADEDTERGADLQDRLLASDYRWRGPEVFPLHELAVPGPRQAELLRRLTLHPPFHQLAEILRGRLEVLHRSRENAGSSPAAPILASIHVVLVNPTRNLSSPDLAARMAELLVMVNGSAAAVVHGNLKAEEITDRALGSNGLGSPPLRPSGGSTFDPGELSHFAKLLLEKAIELTGSRLGNVYLASRDGVHLELIAHERNEDPRDLIEIDDRQSVVSWVYRRKRPMVINSIPDFLRDRPGGFIDVAGALGTPHRELAVPIVEHFSTDGEDRAIGVVNVEKLRGDDQFGGDVYSYRDVTVLRSVAQRIAMKRASSLVDQASATLAGLMKRSTSAAEWRGQAEPSLDDKLPADAVAAQEIVNEALGGVHGLTQSYSTTVRLLSPSRRWLVRFAAFPAGQISESPDAIAVSDKESVGAWVARTGLVCNLKNVKDRSEFRRYPDLKRWLDTKRQTKSELCVPIIVAGRIVGVMNLESRFRDGYHDSVGIAGAVAEQVGLAIQYARRFHEQAVLSMSTATTANVHELGKLSEELHTIVSKEHPRHANSLRSIAHGILRFSRSGAALPDLPPATLWNLVHEALAELHLSQIFTVYQEPPRDWTYAGTDALAVRGALIPLLDNANRRSDPDEPGCGLGWRTSTIGGKEYGTLLIANQIRVDLDPRELTDLYRKPLRREHASRVRLGAFTAGALIRSLGGDVFVEHSKRPYFIVGIDLPVDLCLSDQTAKEA